MVELKVNEVMTTDVVVLRSSMTLCEATTLMAHRGVSGAPVIDQQGKLKGILTERDILNYARSMEGKGLRCPTLSFLALPYEEMVRDEKLCREYQKVGEAKVEDVMTTDVVTISPEDTVRQAAMIMVRFKVNHLPVVKEEVLVGMVARADVLWAMYRESIDRTGGASPNPLVVAR